MARVFIGIGSNLGDRQAHMELARQQLAQLPDTQLIAFSTIIETQPVSHIPQGKYLNAAAELRTSLSPLELHKALVHIESLAGRPSLSTRLKWGPRTLDLDILLYDDRIISSGPLMVPHPLMHERQFVLKPLAELDPNLVHPILEMTIGELLHYLQKQAQTSHTNQD